MNLGRPPGASFGARLTEAGPPQIQDVSTPTTTDQQQPADMQPLTRKMSVGTEDSEVCFICASPIVHIAIAPCNHQTCHICSLRLRALYKTRACAHCRTESPYVIFTDSPDKRYEEFSDDEFMKIDSNLGIKYEKPEIFEDTILLLRYNCPDHDCDAACLGWPDLHRHVKSKHGKTMCDLCTRNKKVFTHEHELFTFGELRKHERHGDDRPGDIDQSGFRGHPECGFCRKRFYGDDELYTHCREAHERCHICDRRNGGRNPQYYLNYQELEKHFAAEHFVCLDAECQANKTNVFESEMDLKAHQLSEHPNGLSKDARRDARLINMSGFDQMRTPYQPERGGRRGREGREGRGNGRGRDPNAEPLPQSSAQPQSRAELAFQRQLAIQSAQSVTNRTFGGQLTQPSQPARQAAPAPMSPRPQQAEALPQLENLTIDTANMTPQEQARQLRHQAVTERATNLLHSNQTKLATFRSHVSNYRTGKTTAQDLIDAFFSLFDCPSSELGKLIRELADLYEDETKRHSLLEAWNSWRSINEDYPSLPGPSGAGIPGLNSSSSIGSYANATTSQSSANLAATLGANVTSGRRVLKLKSSTAQSRNAAANNSAAARALANPEAFPALASSRSLRPQGHNAPSWGGTQPQVSSTHLSVMPRPAPTSNPASSRKATLPPTMTQRQNEDLFPSLPKAAKPNVMISGVNTRATGRFGGSGPNSGANTPKMSAWAAAPTPSEAARALEAVNGNGVGEGGEVKTKKTQGKKKGQQIDLRALMS